MNHITKTLFGGAAVAAVLTVTAAPAGAAEEQGSESTSTVQFFADPETAVGESILRRTADGVQATFNGSEIEPGHAVTLWWVVFNQPENCSAPGCGEDDIFVDGDPSGDLNVESVAAVDVVAGFAAGTVASADGNVWMAARLAEGQPGSDVILGEGALLKDAEAAEIHLVARDHGPGIAGSELDQWTSYAGGCETNLFPPESAEAEGECVDLQFAVHQP